MMVELIELSLMVKNMMKNNLVLVKGHYFINDYTQLTFYCLENYEEVKDIKDCNKINIEKYNGKYKKCNDRFIKAFQVFKMLIDTGGKLITPMELTDEVLNTQFYDKVDDYETLHYNETNCGLEEDVKNIKTNINYSLVLKPLLRNINTCHIDVGFTMMTYTKYL